MNTKEAIEFLEECQDEIIDLQEKGHDELLIKVINLLKRGEKYEKILDELKIDVQGLRKKAEDNSKIDELRSFSIIHEDIKRLEQKYFPKGK